MSVIVVASVRAQSHDSHPKAVGRQGWLTRPSLTPSPGKIYRRGHLTQSHPNYAANEKDSNGGDST